MHRKGFAAFYWVLAFVVTIVGIVFGARVGNGGAPEFGDSTTGASAGSHLVFAVVGAAVGGLIVVALFAGAWIALWAADRRSRGVFDDGEYGSFDDFDDMDEEEDDDVEASRDAGHEEARQTR